LAGQEQSRPVSRIREPDGKVSNVVELERNCPASSGRGLRIFPSKKKNTRQIFIQYFSLDEFDRIVEKFNDNY